MRVCVCLRVSIYIFALKTRNLETQFHGIKSKASDRNQE